MLFMLFDYPKFFYFSAWKTNHLFVVIIKFLAGQITSLSLNLWQKSRLAKLSISRVLFKSGSQMLLILSCKAFFRRTTCCMGNDVWESDWKNLGKTSSILLCLVLVWDYHRMRNSNLRALMTSLHLNLIRTVAGKWFYLLSSWRLLFLLCWHDWNLHGESEKTTLIKACWMHTDRA